MIFYTDGKPLNGAWLTQKLKYDKHRAPLLGTWYAGYEGAAHYLRVFMAQIRQKLEPSPARPRYFHTEPGRGYRFQNDEPDRADRLGLRLGSISRR